MVNKFYNIPLYILLCNYTQEMFVISFCIQRLNVDVCIIFSVYLLVVIHQSYYIQCLFTCCNTSIVFMNQLFKYQSSAPKRFIIHVTFNIIEREMYLLTCLQFYIRFINMIYDNKLLVKGHAPIILQQLSYLVVCHYFKM